MSLPPRARTKMVERAYREVSRQDERSRTDRERLEMIARGKPAAREPVAAPQVRLRQAFPA